MTILPSGGGAPIGIGLVGYGGIGRVHALCLQMLPLMYPDLPRARIVAVASGGQVSAARAAAELGIDSVSTDIDDLLRHPGVQIVDCCTPTDDHARVALAALAAGKALLCEKPLASTGAEAQQIAALASARGLTGGVNFHFRGAPALQEARRFVASGALGEVVGFHLRYHRASNVRRDRPVSWRMAGPGSGVLQDLGTHMIDLALWLLGPIARVQTQLRTLIPERPGLDGKPQTITADDMAWLDLTLAGGGRGTIEVSKCVPGAADDVRVEAYGTRGALTFDSRSPNQLALAEIDGGAGGRQIGTFSRTTPAASLPPPESSSGWIQWHAASIAGFVAAYAAGAQPDADLAAGAAVQRVVDAAFAAAASGGWEAVS